MNIYVGNLPHATTEPELKAAFEEFGVVSSVAIIKDRYTGKSRGFGFVEMPDDDEANEALTQLNGSDFGGRTLRINEARPREKRDSRDSRDSRPSRDSRDSRDGGGYGNRGGGGYR